MINTKIKKKAQAFDTINNGLIALMAFVLISVLVVTLIQTTKETKIICPETIDGDTCNYCPTGFDYVSGNKTCCNSTGGSVFCSGVNTTTPLEYDGHAWNSTKGLQDAGNLPPQFAQIIVIVIVIVGILAMLTAIGYGAYQAMKK